MRNVLIKLIFIIPILGLFSLASCGDDDDGNIPIASEFENLTFEEIMSNATSLSNQPIAATSSNGNPLGMADILIYRTNGNRFGKLEIIDFDQANNLDLSFRAVTYNADGSVFNQTDFLVVRGTFFVDLDLMLEEGANPNDRDFQLRRLNVTDSNIEPRDGAMMSVF